MPVDCPKCEDLKKKIKKANETVSDGQGIIFNQRDQMDKLQAKCDRYEKALQVIGLKTQRAGMFTGDIQEIARDALLLDMVRACLPERV